MAFKGGPAVPKGGAKADVKGAAAKGDGKGGKSAPPPFVKGGGKAMSGKNC
jgi:hypothetical protein